ncbi:exodeoxyribonuclease VII small subunit [bacterium]|nr:MAG: exodeoxyribonuclease VII small subunit [bacterium]
MSETERLDFEEALKRLQHIIEQLEDDSLNLEKSINLYEEGVALSRQCATYLEDVKLRIEKVNQTDS